MKVYRAQPENIQRANELRRQRYRSDPSYLQKSKEHDRRYYKSQKYAQLGNNKKRRQENQTLRKQTDPQYKLSLLLRNRILKFLKKEVRSGSAIKLLGCPIEQAVNHIESKFQPGMTWKNWTHKGWHLDHIRPLISFDLTNPQQLAEACHISNLQPLWASENCSKGAKIINILK